MRFKTAFWLLPQASASTIEACWLEGMAVALAPFLVVITPLKIGTNDTLKVKKVGVLSMSS